MSAHTCFTPSLQDKVDAGLFFDHQMAKAALAASDMKEACAVAVAQVRTCSDWWVTAQSPNWSYLWWVTAQSPDSPMADELHK